MTVETFPLTASHTLGSFLPFSLCGAFQLTRRATSLSGLDRQVFTLFFSWYVSRWPSLYAWNALTGMPAVQLSVRTIF